MKRYLSLILLCITLFPSSLFAVDAADPPDPLPATEASEQIFKEFLDSLWMKVFETH